MRCLKPALLLTVSCVVSCARGAPVKGSEDTARVAALEERIDQLEKRLADVEDTAALMDTVMAGVTEILERLDALQANGPGRRGPDPAEVYAVPIEGDPFIGPAHAKVTMIKAFDFYCGYCNRVRPVLAELREDYGDDLKIVFKDFVIHDDTARLPALAACAAHRQGKFMPMFDRIWKRGLEAKRELEESDLLAIARSLKLKIGRFKKDMYGDCEAEVRLDQAQLAAVGTRGTPAFYINGRFVSGARPIEHYKVVIDAELAKAERAIAAGTPLESYYDSVLAGGKTAISQ